MHWHIKLPKCYNLDTDSRQSLFEVWWKVLLTGDIKSKGRLNISLTRKGLVMLRPIPTCQRQTEPSLSPTPNWNMKCTQHSWAQWLRCRVTDSPLRGPGFESCAAVLKSWASFFTLHCSGSLSSLNEYLAVDRGGYVYEQPSCINCSREGMQFQTNKSWFSFKRWLVSDYFIVTGSWFQIIYAATGKASLLIH